MQAESSTQHTEIKCQISCVNKFNMIGKYLDAAFLVGLAHATLARLRGQNVPSKHQNHSPNKTPSRTRRAESSFAKLYNLKTRHILLILPLEYLSVYNKRSPTKLRC